MADIQTAIRETTDLFKKHTLAEDWSDNIMKGSRSLKTSQQWTNYYAWLASPSTYCPERIYKPISDKQIKEYTDPELDKRLAEMVYKNGTETIIHIKKRTSEESEDEKNPDT